MKLERTKIKILSFDHLIRVLDFLVENGYNINNNLYNRHKFFNIRKIESLYIYFTDIGWMPKNDKYFKEHQFDEIYLFSNNKYNRKLIKVTF